MGRHNTFWLMFGYKSCQCYSCTEIPKSFAYSRCCKEILGNVLRTLHLLKASLLKHADKTWVCETLQQSSVWRSRNELKPKNHVKVGQKPRCCSSYSLITVNKVNKEYYLAVLRRLLEAIVANDRFCGQKIHGFIGFWLTFWPNTKPESTLSHQINQICLLVNTVSL